MKKIVFILIATLIMCGTTSFTGYCDTKAQTTTVNTDTTTVVKSKSKTKTRKSKSSTSSSSSTYNGRTIYTGPRGGQYYYSASGKKVYIKRK
jgi:colicin import membrane protein